MTVHITPLPEPVAPSPAPDGGLGALATDKGNLPLDSVDVHAAITGLAAGIEVVQGFRNPFDVPLEATYIFPLPDRAAVTAMRMEAADRVIEGMLKERGQARQDYDDAIAAGKRAAIAEEERPDVFTMRVGNILPGERVTIRLTLNQPLPYEDDAATFRFPLVVAPRFIPGAPLDDAPAGNGVSPDTDAVPDASRISPPVLLPGFPNPVRMSVTTDIDPAGLPLTEIRSALHVVAESRQNGESRETGQGGRTTVRLQPGERLNRDFILRLAYAPQDGGDEAVALALTPDESEEKDDTGEDTFAGEGTFTLTVLPSGASQRRSRDVVLILDRSGSMHGWKMIAARRAAARIVDTLTGDDRFAVLSFDNVIERPRDLDTGLSPATDRNRFRAVEHLASVQARGGTQMLQPLEEACTLLADSANDRVIVLITDGQVGNEDQILRHLAPRLRGVRVHTVGIDRAVNAGFLRRLAADGEGRCELVESEDRLDEAMEHIHHRIGAPIATDLTLHPEGLELVPDTVAPRRLGALFPGVPLVISGRYRGASPSGALTVRGVASDRTPWEQTAAGTVTKDAATAAVWARAHLRDLEDRYAVDGGDDLERRIVDTSLRFGVLCRFTAFVAVDSRVVAEREGSPHQVVQPVEMPDGWGAEAAMAPGDSMRLAAPGAALPMAYGSAPLSAQGSAPAADLFGAPLAPPAAGAPPAAPAAPGGFRGSSARPVEPGSAPESAASASPASGRRRAGRPGGRHGSVRSAQALSEARRELSKVLQRLRQVGEQRDVQHLKELLTRLAPIVQRLEGRGVDSELVAPLAALATDLQVVRAGTALADLDALWERALQVLADFTGDSGKSATGKDTRRAFWKRNN
ncbi:VIT domain-containing protein [Actinomadura rudentiformis]|uniref:VWA domain-containing protein n=1 Tax=Actinomadura rudentiformis TaxID=359158 RepID=A0A6H9Z226_9ACTN|nr:VIT domain-containing protein [Actinomadura rudentiformis]KAB2350833.1 VWA domain-containing protein [Actinomadura rudentiformis]